MIKDISVKSLIVTITTIKSTDEKWLQIIVNDKTGTWKITQKQGYYLFEAGKEGWPSFTENYLDDGIKEGMARAIYYMGGFV